MTSASGPAASSRTFSDPTGAISVGDRWRTDDVPVIAFLGRLVMEKGLMSLPTPSMRSPAAASRHVVVIGEGRTTGSNRACRTPASSVFRAVSTWHALASCDIFSVRRYLACDARPAVAGRAARATGSASIVKQAQTGFLGTRLDQRFRRPSSTLLCRSGAASPARRRRGRQRRLSMGRDQPGGCRHLLQLIRQKQRRQAG